MTTLPGFLSTEDGMTMIKRFGNVIQTIFTVKSSLRWKNPHGLFHSITLPMGITTFPYVYTSVRPSLDGCIYPYTLGFVDFDGVPYVKCCLFCCSNRVDHVINSLSDGYGLMKKWVLDGKITDSQRYIDSLLSIIKSYDEILLYFDHMKNLTPGTIKIKKDADEDIQEIEDLVRLYQHYVRDGLGGLSSDSYVLPEITVTPIIQVVDSKDFRLSSEEFSVKMFIRAHETEFKVIDLEEEIRKIPERYRDFVLLSAQEHVKKMNLLGAFRSLYPELTFDKKLPIAF